MKNKLLIIFALIILGIVITFVIINSPKDISKIKSEEYIGKTVIVKGIVKNTVKIGSLSGFTIEDTTGTIAVSSEQLPLEGKITKVKGTLIKDSIFGYYIKTR